MTEKQIRLSCQGCVVGSRVQESLSYPYLLRLPLLDADNLLPEREVAFIRINGKPVNKVYQYRFRINAPHMPALRLKE